MLWPFCLQISTIEPILAVSKLVLLYIYLIYKGGLVKKQSDQFAEQRRNQKWPYFLIAKMIKNIIFGVFFDQKRSNRTRTAQMGFFDPNGSFFQFLAKKRPKNGLFGKNANLIGKNREIDPSNRGFSLPTPGGYRGFWKNANFAPKFGRGIFKNFQKSGVKKGGVGTFLAKIGFFGHFWGKNPFFS